MCEADAVEHRGVSEGERRRDLGQVALPRLHRRFAADPPQPVELMADASGGPHHDRTLRDERHDRVDAELGELLHDPLGSVALDRSEEHGDRRVPTGDRTDLSGGFERSSEPRCAPPARAVGDRERVTETEPEHGEVVAIGIGEDEMLEIVHEDVRTGDA